MKKFDVNIKANTWYCAIEADTEQEAIEIALEWFLEYKPDVYCAESEEDDIPREPSWDERHIPSIFELNP